MEVNLILKRLSGSLLLIVLQLAFPLNGFANVELLDTVIKIKEVDIVSVRLRNFSSGIKSLKFDSVTMSNFHHRSLGDLLSEESGIFIRSYGIGSLATSSFRGGSSSHTALVWNNFNINSPMNGILDLSLMPTAFFNDVEVQYGGTSALWGSGAMGGAIHLNNKTSYNEGIKGGAQVNFGSFGNFSQQGNLSYSKNKFSGSTAVLHQKSQNDFVFFNPYLPAREKARMQHAELSAFGVITQKQLQINEKNEVRIAYWHQQMQRNLPPTLLQTNSKASQDDMTHRFTGEWNFQGKKFKSTFRNAYFDELIHYTDLNAGIDDRNKAQTFISEFETTFDINKNHGVNAGINNSYFSSVTGGYPFNPTQNRLALFGSYQFVNNQQKLYTTLSLRQEFVDIDIAPFTGSLSAEYKFKPGLSLYGSAARVFRLPTFNDLFWMPGGNPDLLPENGFTQDLGFRQEKAKNKLKFSYETTVFNRNIKDWIIWLPTATYWQPQNIQKVWSRGLENKISVAANLNNWSLKFTALGNYVLSTNMVAKSDNDASVGKQLIYVPKFTGMAKLDIGYRNVLFTYRHNYNSRRYTTTDNFAFLPSFHLGNVVLAYTFANPKSTSRFFVEINNLFNHEYQAIRTRPMPLRHFNTGFSFTFK